MDQLMKLLLDHIINQMFYILKWMKSMQTYNKVVIKYVHVQLFMKVMKKHLLKEKNLKTFITLLLLN